MSAQRLIRILMVEDEPDIRAIAKLALEVVGKFTVQLCASGEEALKAVQQFNPDLILLDVMMPGMDGPATLKALRDIPSMMRVPVIFMTAKIQPQEISQYKNLGALDVIAKPFDPMTLSATLKDIWHANQTPEGGTEISIQDQLDALCKDYTRQVPGKINEITIAWNTWREQPDNRQALKHLHLLAHSLSGSCATFGLSVISEASHKLEMQLDPLLESGAPLQPEQLVMIAGLISGLAATEVSASQIKANPAPADLSAAQSKNKLIFLVEDGHVLAKELALQLEYFGYSVRIFTQFAGLREAVRETPPAAIIMDIMLSEGPTAGTELLAEIQHRREPSLPVIFISSRSDLAARLKAVQAGGYAYLTKPVDVNELVDKLDQLTSYRPPEPYSILIVEDEPNLANHYALILQQAEMHTAIANNAAQVMKALAEFKPDLILMDMYMPDCSGTQLAAVIRQQDAHVNIPIAFLSSETNLKKQLNAMQTGGDAFLTKPIEPYHLISAVSARVQRARALGSFMVHDSLTGLLNHSRTTEQLNVELARAKRQRQQLTFVMIDIDHFKLVNDSYGHLTGDRVLKSLARLLRQRLRTTDIVGRYGGEEFAVILPDTDTTNALKVIDQIRAGFAQIQQLAEGKEFNVTFSAGVASFPPCVDVTALIDHADRAMYEAKHAGRNKVISADD